MTEVKAILCPNCGKLISASAEQCIHCGMKNPGLWGMGGFFRQIFSISFIPVITATCVIFYVLSILIDPASIFQMHGFLSFLSPSLAALDRLGMTGTIAMARGQWWTLITAIYLHGGILHILFNVLWIRQLGPVVEEFYGVARTFAIFTIAGVVGFLFSNYAFILSPRFVIHFTIGASGSIFGLLGALVYYGKQRGGAFGTAIYRQMGQWAIVLFVLGFLMPGINNFAHAGGFIGGYLAAALLGFSDKQPERFYHQILALLLIGLTGLSFLIVFFTWLF